MRITKNDVTFLRILKNAVETMPAVKAQHVANSAFHSWAIQDTAMLGDRASSFIRHEVDAYDIGDGELNIVKGDQQLLHIGQVSDNERTNLFIYSDHFQSSMVEDSESGLIGEILIERS